MTVRELINELIDLPKDSEVGLSISKMDTYGDKIITVAGSQSIKVEIDEPIIGDAIGSIVWINGAIAETKVVS